MTFNPYSNLIKSGFKFRDAKGQLVATLTRDAHRGDQLSPDMFKWEIEPPQAGEEMPLAITEILKAE